MSRELSGKNERKDGRQSIKIQPLKMERLGQDGAPYQSEASEISIISLGGEKMEKIPEVFRSRIRSRRLTQRKNSIKEERVASIFKNNRNLSVCEICEGQYPQLKMKRMTNCEHQYCEQCLEHYIQYKIGMFEKIICPEENCSEELKITSAFFKQLPADMQKRYKKIHLHMLTVSQPHLRLCPNENCEEGILNIKSVSKEIKCESCKKQFCAVCFFPVHEGPCTTNQVSFLVNNYEWKQCKKCKIVVEKNQGCNHITCRCGYQFCYICGMEWQGNGHLCPVTFSINFDEVQPDPPFDCLNEIDTENCCGRVCGWLIKLLISPLFLLKFILKLVFLLCFFKLVILMTVLFGCTGQLCTVICEERSAWQKIVMCVFLPVTILYSIALSFNLIFIPAIAQDAWPNFVHEVRLLIHDYFYW